MRKAGLRVVVAELRTGEGWLTSMQDGQGCTILWCGLEDGLPGGTSGKKKKKICLPMQEI